jgi:hypothetical protein
VAHYVNGCWRNSSAATTSPTPFRGYIHAVQEFLSLAIRGPHVVSTLSGSRLTIIEAFFFLALGYLEQYGG